MEHTVIDCLQNTQNNQDGLYKEECFLIQGAVFDVYRNLGCGFLEAVYQEALEIELKNRKIPFIAQKEISLSYKGIYLKQTYQADIICYDKIILELKAVEQLCKEHEAQLLNYLHITGFQVGLLINFGHYPKAQIKRMIL